MKTKILRNTFVSVFVLVGLAMLLTAGTNDGLLNSGNMPLNGHPPPVIITFDAPGAGTGSGQGTLAQAINPGGVDRGVLH
jgi:hypothetical protein